MNLAPFRGNRKKPHLLAFMIWLVPIDWQFIGSTAPIQRLVLVCMRKYLGLISTVRNKEIKLDKTIVLVGLMGAGKSAIGRRLATRLGLRFIDADTEIELRYGATISDIFEYRGEEVFRKFEHSVIGELLECPLHVMAAGGGAFIDPATRHLIRKNALSIWLRAELDVLHPRVLRRENRPLLKKGDPRDILAELIRSRYPVYALADLVVDSVEGTHEKVVEQIIDRITDYRPLSGLSVIRAVPGKEALT